MRIWPIIAWQVCQNNTFLDFKNDLKQSQQKKKPWKTDICLLDSHTLMWLLHWQTSKFNGWSWTPSATPTWPRWRAAWSTLWLRPTHAPGTAPAGMPSFSGSPSPICLPVWLTLVWNWCYLVLPRAYNLQLHPSFVHLFNFAKKNIQEYKLIDYYKPDISIYSCCLKCHVFIDSILHLNRIWVYFLWSWWFTAVSFDGSKDGNPCWLLNIMNVNSFLKS